MTIDGLQTVGVTYDDIHTIAFAQTFTSHDAYLTREGSTDGVANVDLDVEAFVLALPT